MKKTILSLLIISIAIVSFSAIRASRFQLPIKQHSQDLIFSTNDEFGGRDIDSSLRGNIIFNTWDKLAPIERFRITSAGNVGIGTTAPQAKLDVAGDLHINGDIYTTPWATWTPTLSANGSMTWTLDDIEFARWMQVGKTVYFQVGLQGTAGGTPNTDLRFSLPVAPKGVDNYSFTVGNLFESGNSKAGMSYWEQGASVVVTRRYDNANISAGLAIVRVSGFYEVD